MLLFLAMNTIIWLIPQQEQPFLLPYFHLKIPLFNKYASFCYMLYIKDPSLFFLKTMHYKPYSAPPILNFIYKSHFTYTTNNNTCPSLNIKAVIQFQGSSDSIPVSHFFFPRCYFNIFFSKFPDYHKSELKSRYISSRISVELVAIRANSTKSYSILTEINRNSWSSMIPCL